MDLLYCITEIFQYMYYNEILSNKIVVYVFEPDNIIVILVLTLYVCKLLGF